MDFRIDDDRNVLPVLDCDTVERLSHAKGASRDPIAMLKEIGVRPTSKRISLANLLFGKGGRHVTAEMLHEEAARAHICVSLATVYNTLNQFVDAGLLRQISVDGTKTYFDTNVSDHQHFYLENGRELMDMPAVGPLVSNLPDMPDGYEINRIDVVVRLRKKV